MTNVEPVAQAVALSKREIECLTLLASGFRPDRIAHMLGLARGTVEFHIRNARMKLRARTREQAVALALALHLISVE